MIYMKYIGQKKGFNEKIKWNAHDGEDVWLPYNNQNKNDCKKVIIMQSKNSDCNWNLINKMEICLISPFAPLTVIFVI